MMNVFCGKFAGVSSKKSQEYIPQRLVSQCVLEEDPLGRSWREYGFRIKIPLEVLQKAHEFERELHGELSQIQRVWVVSTLSNTVVFLELENCLLFLKASFPFLITVLDLMTGLKCLMMMRFRLLATLLVWIQGGSCVSEWIQGQWRPLILGEGETVCEREREREAEEERERKSGRDEIHAVYSGGWIQREREPFNFVMAPRHVLDPCYAESVGETAQSDLSFPPSDVQGEHRLERLETRDAMSLNPTSLLLLLLPTDD